MNCFNVDQCMVGNSIKFLFRGNMSRFNFIKEFTGSVRFTYLPKGFKNILKELAVMLSITSSTFMTD